MEQTTNRIAPEAPADESASPRNARPAPPAFDPPPLLSDTLGEALSETFPEGGRKPRHDGWTPEAVAGFLEHLAATGVVEHAARAVGLSAQSAYAFRNRRQGRAFAMMWDAVLVHRARARVASELQGRSIAGCVSIRKRDGEVVGEYHYYDNRLAMAMLTRLDRLAEREAANDAHLRALSEDLDGFCECVAAGGDPDAFVEALKPPEPEPEPEPLPRRPDDDPELTRMALFAGCPSYRDVNPIDIPVYGLDPGRQSEWEAEEWIRAFRSGFMLWLENQVTIEPAYASGPGSALRFDFARRAIAARVRLEDSEAGFEVGKAEDIDTGDLDPARIFEWTDDQLIRGWHSGVIPGLPPDFWHALGGQPASDGEEE